MNQKVTVIGAGTMGSGIAQIAAEAGFDVTIVDTDRKFIDSGIGGIGKFLERKAAKGTISKEKMDQSLSRLKGTTDMKAGVEGAVMVIEAVFEKLDLKKEIFTKLDTICPAEVILASNTSTLSITGIAEVTKNPGRVIGTHYFSPVPLMKLVEVIRGEKTTDGVTEKTVGLCKQFAKIPIVVKDIPGFIVNRFLCLIYNEAANMIHNGAASAEAIDQAMKLGCNWPMGPNEIMDLAGIDVCYFAIDAMYRMTGHEGYKPSPLFKKMLDQNLLGRKTGRGFYGYEKKP
ncbi:MAG: 3-hydroxyacyl-CoA dehydrogenase family protein [Syntrophobacteraceae bacterium]|jgi:3-hydroxybutyryl-CoA dehydrogenase